MYIVCCHYGMYAVLWLWCVKNLVVVVHVNSFACDVGEDL